MATMTIDRNPGTQPLTMNAKSNNSSSTTESSLSTNSLGTTFLKLLTQELQHQDPTTPMDSTQMVGQMISLNQLSQLTSINQTLSGRSAVNGIATSGSSSEASGSV